MNRVIQILEIPFAIASLVFFTRVLDFESFSKASEGAVGSMANAETNNVLDPFLSLIQHSIFLAVVCLLVLRSQDTIKTLTHGKIIWILVILVLLSFLWSNIPDISFRGAFAFMETCAFGLYFASRYNINEQLRLIACALGITSLISLLYTLVLPSYGIENGIHLGAWRGPFIQKNIFARILVLACLSFVCMDSKQLWQKFLVFAGLTLSFSLIILSQSTTALMVLALLLMLNVIYKLLCLKDIVAIPLMLVSLIAAIVVAAWVLSNAETILSSVGKDLTLSGRTTIWAILIEQIKLRPWLGYGYLGFWRDPAAISLMTKTFGTTYVPAHSHNGYLELLTSFGFVGVLLFSITLIALARRSLILVVRERSQEGFWPLLFLSYIVFYNFSEPTLIEHNSMFWIIYLSLAISRFIEFEPEPQSLSTETTPNKYPINIDV
ncbi:MAG: O-antigen ligase [Pleurocapsa sp.]